MTLRWLASSLLLLACACNTVKSWQELETGPMTFAEVYDGVDFIARADGFTVSTGESDRGLGIWQSRWRHRQLGLNRPGRFRLRAELEDLGGNGKSGWRVRFYVEQMKVKDLKKSMNPEEDDWSSDGQDVEREFLFARRLSLRLKIENPDGSRKGAPAQ
jgi:hypothetical protein